MLVILSDLHFCDQTSVERNYDVSDFTAMMEDIYELSLQYQGSGPDRTIDIVLLGDIFDLLRTERWFDVPPARRPWGSAEALDRPEHSQETLAHARTIAREIISCNEDIFKVLRCEDSQTVHGCRVRRLYIPGNHDRLFLHDREMRDMIRRALGTVDAFDESSLQVEGIYRHHLALPSYNLLCRHGHEWDAWNFECFTSSRALPDYDDDAYLYTPIGDAITTELVARLPYELHRRLSDSSAFRGHEGELTQIRARMQCIEEVRPLLAAFHWVSYEARRIHSKLETPQARALEDAVSDTLLQISRDFKALDFFQAWHERHDRFGVLDDADKLQGVLAVCSTFHWLRLQDLAGVFGPVEAVLQFFGKDLMRRGAATEAMVGDGGLRFVVYGHTHEPTQVALRAGDSAEDLYLNSGTWRRRHYATDDGSGFIGWQRFTYMIFYNQEELAANRKRETRSPQDRQGAGYEYWTGARMRGVAR